MSAHGLFALAFIAILMLGSSPQSNLLRGLDKKHPMQIDKAAKEIRILAEFQPGAFSGFLKWTPNYHAVVWKKGKAAREALFAAYIDDLSFYDALQEIGAVPGNNLTQATWDERKNPKSHAPDTRIAGTPVELWVWWPRLTRPIPFDSLLLDPGGRGLDLRFGGNKALIPKWKSGCIVCLYSCPGSKVGNHAYTVRDYVKGTTHFQVNKKIAPRKKTTAVLIFRLGSGANTGL
ncbi:MAG: hypothetical protein D6814_14525 [Calditrichaeota bacterium]|nr:MAG: hypothetical protein D6814_14525 [Calditrichota bacterium]